jgi:hypothetical protein
LVKTVSVILTLLSLSFCLKDKGFFCPLPFLFFLEEGLILGILVLLSLFFCLKNKGFSRPLPFFFFLKDTGFAYLLPLSF